MAPTPGWWRGMRLPTPTLRSDIRDVVYVNYVVGAQALSPFVPRGLELRRVGPGGKHAVFTFVTFRHGHLGPHALGPLRALFPSPVQSNWRTYVWDPTTGKKGVVFITTAISSRLFSWLTRISADNMPMHVPRRIVTMAEGVDPVRVEIEPGRSAAPDARCMLRESVADPAEGPWSVAFKTWRDMLAFVVPQDRSMAAQEPPGRIVTQEMVLEIPLAQCRALEGSVRSRAASRIAGEARPFCFWVPRVRLTFFGQRAEPVRDLRPTPLDGRG